MKIFFVSLGCDKNSVDTEMMIGVLMEAGHEITYDESEAEAVIVNSCAFIGDAKQESINNILEMAELKRTARLRVLIVTGCLAQRYQDEIFDEIPEVDAIVGTQSFASIAEVLKEAEDNNRCIRINSLSEPAVCGLKRVLTSAPHYAYMKIAEGCDKHCTYCIIPSMRGRYRSIPTEVLIKEAKNLASRGVKELILVAQETTLYGMDLYGEKRLPKLLGELTKVEGIESLRLLYCYPEEITDELIETIRDNDKICNYLDIPIQSGSDKILKAMGRHTTQQDIRELIGKLRSMIPDIAIRTTLISGFPGESYSEHRRTYKFVKDMCFDRLGVFAYSAEEGTPAATMSHQVPEWIKNLRKNSIMRLQKKIAYEMAEQSIGNRYTVTIEGNLVEEGVYVGRTYKDAPSVDGFVFVKSDRNLMSGDRIEVLITEARGYDLCGEEIINN